jgi:hypothetical protein
MKKRYQTRAKKVGIRLFIGICVFYTVISFLFDYNSSTNAGISVTPCSSIFIDASSEDDLKRQLVEEFAPTLVFSLGEPADLKEEVIVPYQMVPDQEDMSRYVWRGAVTYPTDYGTTSFGARLTIGEQRYSVSLSKTVLRVVGWAFGQVRVDSHIGDVEMFELYLKPTDEEGHWEIDGLGTFPHGKRKMYNASQVRCFRDSPIFYVSRGKHAIYPSLRECNQNSSVFKSGAVQLTAEQCSVEELYYPSTSSEFNVGDSTNPVNIFVTSPTLRESEIFQGEDVWGNCFYGGYGDSAKPNTCRSRFRWW